MKATWKRKWLKALRSGKYEQAKGSLKKDGGYCCLGVLRDVINPNSRAGDEYLCKTHSLLVGLPHEGSSNEVGTQYDLAAMNDAGKSFKEIANYIEKRL
jgi:hypothetical protein